MLINEYNPDSVTPPGETLRTTIEAMGIKETDLSSRLGMSLKAVSEIINGKKPITLETSGKLELVLNIPAVFWNNREMRYREYLLSLERKKTFHEYIGWAQDFPIKKLKELGAIPDNPKGVDLVEALCKFFGIASPGQFSTMPIAQVCYRKQNSPDEKALISWLRLGEIEGRNHQECSAYSRDLFKTNLQKIRELINSNDAPKIFPAVKNMCAESGVVVALIPEMPRAKVCGSSRWLESDKALIQLSLRFKDIGNLWFTFFHEAAHILGEHSKKQILINSGRGEDCSCESTKAQEDAANRYASDILISPSSWRSFIGRSVFTASSINAFAESVKIPPGIVVGRLQHEGYLDWNTPLNKLKVHYKFCSNN